MNLAAAMLARLDSDPARNAIELLSPQGKLINRGDRVWLKWQTAQWMDRFHLTGLEPGDRVALGLGRDSQLVAIHMAALARGLSIVPLNTALAPSEVARLLIDSHVRLIISSAAFAEPNTRTAAALAAPWWIADAGGAPVYPPFVEAPVVAPGAVGRLGATAAARADRDEALVLYTSGTSGRPKSVPLSHGNLRDNLDTLRRLWDFGEEDRLLHILPAHHFHGLVLGAYGTLLAGGQIVLLPSFDARTVLDVIPRLRINLIMGVPTMYARMLAAATDKDDLSGLRLALCGSAPLTASLWEKFYKRFGIRLVERYGLTESGIVSSNPPGAPRPGSVGLPLPGTRVAVRTASGYELPRAGKASPQGELCVSGPSVMSGYGNDPEATNEAIHDGYFHTGDLGRFDPDGYLYIEGRLKDLIIVGGSNVVPGEVERVLTAVEGVRELAVAGMPNEDLGEIVVAFVVPTFVVTEEPPGGAEDNGTTAGARAAGKQPHAMGPEQRRGTPDPAQKPGAVTASKEQAGAAAACKEQPGAVSDSKEQPGVVAAFGKQSAAVAAAKEQRHAVGNEDKPGIAALEQRLRAAAAAGLALYKRPRRYLFVAELPRNTMGKIDRSRLQ